MNKPVDEASPAARLTPYVMRFTLVFSAMSIVAIAVVMWFDLSGNAGLSIGILMASAVSAGQQFIDDQKRVFEGSEKLRMAFYSLLMVVMLSVLFLLALLHALGEDPHRVLGQFLHTMPPRIVAASVLFVFVLNFAMLYLSYGYLIGKIFKGMQRRGEV